MKPTKADALKLFEDALQELAKNATAEQIRRLHTRVKKSLCEVAKSAFTSEVDDDGNIIPMDQTEVNATLNVAISMQSQFDETLRDAQIRLRNEGGPKRE